MTRKKLSAAEIMETATAAFVRCNRMYPSAQSAEVLSLCDVCSAEHDDPQSCACGLMYRVQRGAPVRRQQRRGAVAAVICFLCGQVHTRVFACVPRTSAAEGRAAAPGRSGAVGSEHKTYGHVLTRAEYRADPAAAMRLADEHGAVTIVDEHGVPRSAIFAPHERLECDNEECATLRTRLAAAEARARAMTKVGVGVVRAAKDVLLARDWDMKPPDADVSALNDAISAFDECIAPQFVADSVLAGTSTKGECRACGAALLSANRVIADGCPCNSPRGINHGLVPKDTCTCVACDPEQTGAARDSTNGEEAKRLLDAVLQAIDVVSVAPQPAPVRGSVALQPSQYAAALSILRAALGRPAPPRGEKEGTP